MSTKPHNYEVWRRFSDFWWLKNILEREYPGYYIPPMARKGTKRSFKEIHISRRMEDLNSFIEEVMKSEELRSSVFVLVFLKIKSSKQFNRMKSSLESNKTAINVSYTLRASNLLR